MPDELSVMVQFVFAPVIYTLVPLGDNELPVTLTLTLTFPFTRDGSGLSPVMVVVVELRLIELPPHKRIVEEL
jgi:hypothetical protein